MMRTIYQFCILAVCCLLSLFSSNAIAQDNLLYNMHRIPQSIQMNPAIQPACKVYVGLPGVKAHFNHSGPAFRDVFQVSGDSLLHPFHPDYSGNFYKKLHKRNYINTEYQADLFSLGFGGDGKYMSFNIAVKGQTFFRYPENLFSITEGNLNYDHNHPTGGTDYKTLELGFGMMSMQWAEIGFGYSQEINHKLTVGGRFKYLKGMAIADVRSAQVALSARETDDMPSELVVNTDFRIRTSPLPYDLPADENGYIDFDTLTSDDYDVIPENFGEDFSSDFMFNGNFGLGVDLGAIYKFNEQLSVSASVVDLGFLRWKGYPREFESKGEYVFPGVEIGYDQENEEIAIVDHYNTGDEDFWTTQLGDTIKSSFQLKPESDAAFSKSLTTKVFLGATYRLNKNLYFNALSKIWFYDRRPHPSFTLSSNVDFLNAWTFSLAYSMMHRSYNNIGMGFGMRLGPLHTYFLFEKLMLPNSTLVFDGGESSMPFNDNIKFFNVRFGINILVGCRQKIDRPSLIFDQYPCPSCQ